MNLKKPDKTQGSDSYSLKGTFASVLLLAAFVIVTWLGVYFLFIARS